MFAKTTFALAVIIGSTAGAPAATIHQIQRGGPRIMRLPTAGRSIARHPRRTR